MIAEKRTTDFAGCPFSVGLRRVFIHDLTNGRISAIL